VFTLIGIFTEDLQADIPQPLPVNLFAVDKYCPDALCALKLVSLNAKLQDIIKTAYMDFPSGGRLF
jgi:hypothetical protein